MIITNNGIDSKKWFEPSLRILSKLTSFNQKGDELVLYLKMLDFIRSILVSIAIDNKLISQNGENEIIKEKKSHDFGIFRAYSELGIVMEVFYFKDNTVYIHKKYNSKQFKTIKDIEVFLETNDNDLDVSDSRELENFIFVYYLIKLNNENTVWNECLNKFKIKDKWIDYINTDRFKYEIVLCEYILELKGVNLRTKIKFSKDEEFYTYLGKSAFELFTKEYFIKTTNDINEKFKYKNVLDIGCGYGDYIEIIRKVDSVQKIFGVERQSEVFNEVSKRFNEDNKISIVNEDVLNINFEEEIDLVLMNYVMFYFSKEDKIKLFNRLHKVLNKSGKILLCQYYPKTKEMKRKLLKASKDDSLENIISIYFGNAILYAEVLLNETLDDFNHSERWDEFISLLNETGFKVKQITNAEKFYYSFFVVVEKK